MIVLAILTGVSVGFMAGVLAAVATEIQSLKRAGIVRTSRSVDRERKRLDLAESQYGRTGRPSIN